MYIYTDIYIHIHISISISIYLSNDHPCRLNPTLDFNTSKRKSKVLVYCEFNVTVFIIIKATRTLPLSMHLSCK